MTATMESSSRTVRNISESDRYCLRVRCHQQLRGEVQISPLSFFVGWGSGLCVSILLDDGIKLNEFSLMVFAVVDEFGGLQSDSFNVMETGKSHIAI